MNEIKKRRIISDILGSPSTTGKEHLYTCPKCNHHKQKMYINFAKNVFKCWICDYSGRNLRRLVRRHGNFHHVRQWKEFDADVELGELETIFLSNPENSTRIDLPEEFRTLTGSDTTLIARKAKQYLKSRGISKDDIMKWKIGFCATGEYSGRVLIPSFDDEGYCNFFVSRIYDRGWPKYKAPVVSKDIVFNSLYIDWTQPLNLVEGVFDAIKAGTNSIPLLGSSLREESKLFQSIVKHDTPLYVALDADAERKAMQLIYKLLQYGCEVYKVDITGYNDVGEMTSLEYKEGKAAALLLDSDEYLLQTALMA
jgi:DNA primase